MPRKAKGKTKRGKRRSSAALAARRNARRMKRDSKGRFTGKKR